MRTPELIVYSSKAAGPKHEFFPPDGDDSAVPTNANYIVSGWYSNWEPLTLTIRISPARNGAGADPSWSVNVVATQVGTVGTWSATIPAAKLIPASYHTISAESNDTTNPLIPDIAKVIRTV